MLSQPRSPFETAKSKPPLKEMHLCVGVTLFAPLLSTWLSGMQAFLFNKSDFEFCSCLDFFQTKQNGGFSWVSSYWKRPAPSCLSSVPQPFSLVCLFHFHPPLGLSHAVKLSWSSPSQGPFFHVAHPPACRWAGKFNMVKGCFYCLFLTLPALSQPGLVVALRLSVIRLQWCLCVLQES